MAALNFSAFAKPLSASDPCGPDLDLEADDDFMNCLAQADAALPTQFFVQVDSGDGGSRSVTYDRVDAEERLDRDFPGQLKMIGALLGRTRDVRLLSLACRLSALNRDLHGCAAGVAATASLLRDHWDEVHPRPEGGDLGYRTGVLQALDDMATVILPLQHVTLFSHRRYGPISFRSHLIATGAVKARDDETALTERDCERALQDADPDDLAACRQSVARLKEAARAIAAVTAERAGARDAVQLEQLISLADNMAGFLGSLGRDQTDSGVNPVPGRPAAGPLAVSQASAEVDAVADPVPVAGRVESAGGDVATAVAARAALAAVSAYFCRHEPSSPAALLVLQAERLIGLPFQDVIRILLPRHAEDATIYIGPKPEKSFQLNVERVADGLGPRSGEDQGQNGTVEPARFVVGSRAGAVALLRQVAVFYRAHEPSSPIPLFTDRACSLMNQDFLSILADVLPGVRLARDGD